MGIQRRQPLMLRLLELCNQADLLRTELCSTVLVGACRGNLDPWPRKYNMYLVSHLLAVDAGLTKSVLIAP